MSTRRFFLQQLGALTVGSVALHSGVGVVNGAQAAEKQWFMPDEAAKHRCTWMAFGPHPTIWGKRLALGAQQNLATIANAIAQYEPVRMLVRAEDMARAKQLCGKGVELIEAPIDDLWMRDTGPVFVRNAAGELAGIDFNFNGWGEKQEYARDAEVAGLVTEVADVRYVASNLVLEGGSIEVDGEGTAIITESCVLNPNRNPGVAKADCEAELKQLLGLDKIIWLPGIAGKDITDGHTDFYARFTHPGTVVATLEPDPEQFDYAVTRKHLELLNAATDAKGRKLKVVVLEGPQTVRPKYENDAFSAGYINFYVCNGAVVMPQFGDAQADTKAQQALQALFPERDVVALDIDAIAAGGGGIHCATQQQPI